MQRIVDFDGTDIDMLAELLTALRKKHKPAVSDVVFLERMAAQLKTVLGTPEPRDAVPDNEVISAWTAEDVRDRLREREEGHKLSRHLPEILHVARKYGVQNCDDIDAAIDEVERRHRKV